MPEWRKCTWGDVATLAYGKSLSGYKGAGETPVKVFGTNGPIGYTTRALSEGPGVVVGRKGAYRGIHFSSGDFFVIDTAFFLQPTVPLDMRWAYYELLTHDINGMDSGSAIPSTSREAFYGMPLLLPPLPEQRAIAEVLGALDDKIESNRRIWKLRLELAGSAFRRAAKEAETTTPLGELYEVGLSGVWGQDEPGGKATVATSCLRGRDLEDFVAGGVVESPVRFISEKQLSSRVFQNGEIWTAGSGSLGPSLLITEGVARLWENQLTYSNFVKRLVPIGGHDMAEVAWNAVVDTWRNDGFAAFRTGTAMPNLDPSALLAGVQVPVVANESREEIALLTNAALDPQVLMENLALARLRDTLLPALLSGRIRVPVAAELVEAS